MPIPVRTEDASPSDTVLDLWEQATRAALAMGGEAALRARLARLLPGAAAPKPARDLNFELQLEPVRVALAAFGQRSLKPADRALVEAAQSVVTKLKQGRA